MFSNPVTRDGTKLQNSSLDFEQPNVWCAQVWVAGHTYKDRSHLQNSDSGLGLDADPKFRGVPSQGIIMALIITTKHLSHRRSSMTPEIEDTISQKNNLM